MKLNKKRVMIFGGSYNPIHQGHINAALKASSYLNVDEVWLLPRRFDYDGSLLLNSKHRINMIDLAIKHFDNFKVCDVEINDKDRKLVYTYNTAKLLTDKHKNIEFYFLIGADQLNNFRSWYKVDELTKLFKFVCYQRPGYEIDESIKKDYDIHVIEGPQIDVSSTVIREGKFKKIDRDIETYIEENHLYLETRIKNKLPSDRYNHVIAVADLAYKFAKANNVNTTKAYIAGILHDIAKCYPKEEIRKFMEEYFPTKLKIGSYSHHAFVSGYVAEHEYNVKDKEILNAIMNHSTASYKMSKLSKIIYCADKLELTRDFADKVNDIREIGFKDIDLCFIKTLENQIEYLQNTNYGFDKKIMDLYKYYKEKYDGRSNS